MTGARTMLSLAKDYLSERRALGFALRMEGHQITSFALFADERGHSGPLTNDIVLNWVQGRARRASPFSWAWRLKVLRPFARYLARLDPDTEFPETATFGRSHRLTPFQRAIDCRKLSWRGMLQGHKADSLFRSSPLASEEMSHPLCPSPQGYSSPR